MIQPLERRHSEYMTANDWLGYAKHQVHIQKRGAKLNGFKPEFKHALRCLKAARAARITGEPVNDAGETESQAIKNLALRQIEMKKSQIAKLQAEIKALEERL